MSIASRVNLRLTVVVFLLPLALVVACSSSHGSPPPSEPALEAASARLLGLWTADRSQSKPELQLAVLGDFIRPTTGSEGIDRDRAERLVSQLSIPEHRRTVDELVRAVRVAVPQPPTLPTEVMNALVAEAVRLGTSESDPTFQRQLKTKLPQLDASIDLAALREPLAMLLPPAKLVTDLFENSPFPEVGRRLVVTFGQGVTVDRAKEIVLGEVNSVLVPLVDRYRDLSASGGAVELNRFVASKKLLDVVDAVSDFVFGEIFTGDKASEIGSTIKTVARVGSAIAEIGAAVFTGGFSALFSGDLFDTVLDIFGLGGPSLVELKLDQIQHAIEKLGELVELTRIEMHRRFLEVHNRLDVIEANLGRIYGRLNQMFNVMVTGFNQLQQALALNIEAVQRVLADMRTNLADIHEDVRSVYAAVRWFAAEASVRSIEERLDQFSLLMVAARTGPPESARAAVEAAREILRIHTNSRTFAREASIGSLIEAAIVLTSSPNKEPVYRVSKIGASVAVAPHVGAPTIPWPVNFESLYLMAGSLLDTIEIRPEIVSKTERQLIAAEIRQRIDEAIRTLSSLGSVLEGALAALVDRARGAVDRDMPALVATFRESVPLRLRLRSSYHGVGRNLANYLANEDFDSSTNSPRLKLQDDEDQGFTTAALGPYAWLVYERLVGEIVTERFRHRGGFEAIQEGIWYGLIEVRETLRYTNGREEFDLYWNTQLPFVRSSLAELHGRYICSMRLYPAVPNERQPLLRITGLSNQTSFHELYEGTIKRWVSRFLIDLRAHIHGRIRQDAARYLPNLKEAMAAAAVVRFVTELAGEAGRTDPELSMEVRQLLDAPLLFHESLASGRWTIGDGRTPVEWAQHIVDGFVDHLEMLTNSQSGTLPDGVRFYTDALRVDRARDFGTKAEALRARVNQVLMPFLTPPQVSRVANLAELEAAVKRILAIP